jgi:16S rRNA (guanine527-N7)-methyltransferase
MDKELITKIANYQDLIHSWAGRINLISKGDRASIIEDHILDSLGPLDLVPQTGSLIDIGTGAGMPGIPLAILRPMLQVTLLESVHKKILFLRAVKDRLELANVEILEGRLEELEFSQKYDIVTLRALPKWESYLETIRGIIKPGGKIIYYKQRGLYTIMND